MIFYVNFYHDVDHFSGSAHIHLDQIESRKAWAKQNPSERHKTRTIKSPCLQSLVNRLSKFYPTHQIYHNYLLQTVQEVIPIKTENKSKNTRTQVDEIVTNSSKDELYISLNKFVKKAVADLNNFDVPKNFKISVSISEVVPYVEPNKGIKMWGPKTLEQKLHTKVPKTTCPYNPDSPASTIWTEGYKNFRGECPYYYPGLLQSYWLKGRNAAASDCYNMQTLIKARIIEGIPYFFSDSVSDESVKDSSTECVHQPVNIGFNSIKIVCKHCDCDL